MYVNDTGKVNQVNRWPHRGASRKLPEDHPEVLAYLNKPEPQPPITAEELYDMLETKGIVTAIDRPLSKK